MQDASRNHWSENDLLDRVYGLDPRPQLDTAHLDTCPECRERWQAIELRRSTLLEQPGPPVSDRRLREQRQAIFRAIGRPAPLAWQWKTAPVAATALVAVVFFMNRPSPRQSIAEPPAPAASAQLASASDSQLFAEIAAVLDEQPRATEPLRALFAEELRQ